MITDSCWDLSSSLDWIVPSGWSRFHIGNRIRWNKTIAPVNCPISWNADNDSTNLTKRRRWRAATRAGSGLGWNAWTKVSVTLWLTRAEPQRLLAPRWATARSVAGVLVSYPEASRQLDERCTKSNQTNGLNESDQHSSATFIAGSAMFHNAKCSPMAASGPGMKRPADQTMQLICQPYHDT